MPRNERKETMSAIQEKRGGRLLLCYLTSTRAGWEVQIGDDVVRLFFDHLEAGKDKAGQGVDLFLHSNGGAGTVPWKIVNLIREYTDDFAVLVPHHAFSAATLIALGANKIHMHRMGFLGPIDPSVTNHFNPIGPNGPMPISVEDVSSYLKLVKEDVGIGHEDELVKAFTSLTDKVHPLALGNVQRSHQQARMLARKLLKLHRTDDDQDHGILKLVEDLKSNLFYHGHPINRHEAENDLKLNVEAADDALEALMWKLYVDYEKEMKLTEPLNIAKEYRAQCPGQAPTPPTTQEIVQELVNLNQQGVGLGQGLTPAQLVEFATSIIATRGAAPANNRATVKDIIGGFVDSVAFEDRFMSDLEVRRVTATTPLGPQEAYTHEQLGNRWTRTV